MSTPSKYVSFKELSREPFRVFFLLATFAGIAGVLLWPLSLKGFISFYPGQVHARIMTHCFYGGFIIGFLGTALPRMLSVAAFSTLTLLVIAAVYLSMLGLYLTGNAFAGDATLLGLLFLLLILLLTRFPKRKDLPPPGFILMILGFASLVAGTILSLLGDHVSLQLIALQHLLSFQGFVLLPILGIAPFIMPRFFGMESTHDLPESRRITPQWKKKAMLALAAGILVIAGFLLEAWGWLRTGSGVRFVVVATYILLEARVHMGTGRKTLAILLRTGLGFIALGFLAATLFVMNRTALFHIDFAGGFAIVTICVATRVVFGHSGNQKLLGRRNGLIITAVVLMVLGLATRIVADYKPEVMASHYTYGAISWAIGLLFWAVPVLRHAFDKDPED